MKRVVKRSRIAAIVLALTVVFCTSVTDATSTSDGLEFELVLPENSMRRLTMHRSLPFCMGTFRNIIKA